MGYPKHVYKRAGQELQRRQDEARRLNESRAAEIARKLPEILEIQREMAATAVSVTRIISVNPEKAAAEIESLKKRNLELQQKRGEILIKAGYPEDYLTEKKSCFKCGGSGYIGAEMCECFRDILKKEAYSELSAVSQAKNSGFDDFDLNLYPEDNRRHMSDIFESCKRYAKDFSKESPSLLMLGQTGLGKTHLSLAIARTVTESGLGVVYTPVQKLIDKLEANKFSYTPEAREQYARDMENTLSCDLLVLDDLGAEFITQFSSSTLYNIVNTRLVETMPTIISTNLEPAEIEVKYSPRMLSRLIGGYSALKFMGKDIRFVKKMRR